MDDYISKPVNRDEISEALRKWLAPRGTEEETAPDFVKGHPVRG
jgi:YesN/AraC family two-component response regulator